MRQHALRSGLTLTHWPHEYQVRGPGDAARVNEQGGMFTPKVPITKQIAGLNEDWAPTGFAAPRLTSEQACLVTGQPDESLVPEEDDEEELTEEEIARREEEQEIAFLRMMHGAR